MAQRDDIEQLKRDVSQIKHRLDALEDRHAPAPVAEAKPTRAAPKQEDSSRGLGIALIIIGTILSLTIIGAVLGIPLVIGGIIVLSKADKQTSKKAAPTRSAETKRNRASAADSSIVLQALTIIGIVALVLGAVFFLTLSIQNEWISKPVQLLIGLIAGVGIALLGVRMRAQERYGFWGDLVASAGVIIAYFTVYAAYTLEPYRVAIGLSAAVLGIALMLIAGAFLTYTTIAGSRRMTFAAIGLGALTFAFAEPTIVSLIYVTILGIGTRVAASIRSWSWIGAASIVLASLGMLFVGLEVDALAAIVALGILIAVSEALAWQRSEHAYLLGSLPLVAGGLVALPLASRIGWDLGVVSVGLALAAIALAIVHESNARISRALSASFFLTIGTGLLVSPEYIGLTWAALALVLTYSSERFDARPYRIGAHIIAGIGLFAISMTNLPDVLLSSWPALLALPSFYLTIAMIATFVLLSRMNDTIASRIYASAGTVLLVLLTVLSTGDPVAIISVLAALAITYRMIIPDGFYHLQSVFVSGLMVFLTLGFDAFRSSMTSSATGWMYGVTITAVLALNIYTRRQQLEESEAWIVPAGTIITGVLVARITSVLANDAGVTLGWLGAGIAGLVAGIFVSDRTVRITGLALIALAVLKAFLFDVFELELVWRVVAFLALGVALLCAALLYGRYRERIGDLF